MPTIRFLLQGGWIIAGTAKQVDWLWHLVYRNLLCRAAKLKKTVYTLAYHIQEYVKRSVDKQERTRGWIRAVRNGQRSRCGGRTGSARTAAAFSCAFNRRLAKRSGCRAGWPLLQFQSETVAMRQPLRADGQGCKKTRSF